MQRVATDFRLDGEVAIVTGGGSGIGRLMCRAFASRGTKVAVFDIDEKVGQAVVEEIGGDQAIAIACDVSNEVSVGSAVQHVLGMFGRVDVLFNNAGINQKGPTTDLPSRIGTLLSLPT